ncbi:BZ3500_MvSof-1268-A1-R1_Chr10-2g02996 [Microbotryum saponariae]|uniref:BZ3500_MvSof-1268-A1-R1_Chr10-2g02996 protein n=1 Tax=Microbotryum saponariae TaxID=289078 RepID=A0A2X0KAY4_9BASI|nr:BZ3501_MvSof-1269-A2-R1_Chr10-2g02582 [Microbotryum saponariae]SDA01899.1 BZ3500_MvSof-1268-A1-R1_Chr10-2g02996 [Microbotryum saponariae]
MFFRATTVFTSLLLVAPALAAEAPSPDKRGFKVELHSRASHHPHHAGKAFKSGHAHPHAKRLKNGPAHPRRRGAKAHQGHPPFLAATKAGSSQPFAKLTNVGNIDWSADVAFGSPAQHVPLFISMGSPLSTVADKSIKSISKARYDPSKSSTARKMSKAQVDPNSEALHPFGGVKDQVELISQICSCCTANVTVITYKDKVSIAGFEVPDQTFTVMTSTPDGYYLEDIYASGDVPWAGTLGLGRTGKRTPSLSFLENLIRSRIIHQAVCGISITVNGGALDFGFVDSRSYKGQIEWSPVDTDYMESYWTIKTGGWSLNGKVVAGTAGRLQFTPENTYTFISKKLGKQIFAGIKHQVDPETQRYLLPCKSKETDTIGFLIHQRMFSVPIPDLILFASKSNPGMCHTALLQVKSEGLLDDYTIAIGAILMRSFYTILSYERVHGGLALGLAQSSIEPSGGDPSQSEK